ncbi:MAG: DNA gyrase subunit A [Clostridia bacterium]|nr:DNA gyrase subunit A [Clostridia bacterium]
MENQEFVQGSVVDVDLYEEMKKSFMEYSMSVIISRALPDVRDGLKPVHRRILYTMYENALWHDKSYRKCADTVGAVLGRYHPHGDASVYDALVRLAQDFSMRYMLVDGHGNFGSVDGDPPAAYRYTEARMCKLSEDMLQDIDKNTVDFTANYDDRLKEPSVLPSHFPNLLVNGSQGIAVGMATNIPPHNMGEVIDGVCTVIDNPECSLDDIMQSIKGPDFPTGGIIMGRSGIRSAYATGKGKVIVRARTEIVEEKNGRSKIIVSELPYQVNKARLIENIAQLVKEKKIEGITNVEDHSDRNGMHMVIDIRRDAAPQVVLNKLFSFTQMQTTFGVIQLAIVDGEPKTLTLKQILEEYIKFQQEVIRRRTEFDLQKAIDRAHILEGLIVAIDAIDEVINILRNSKSIPEGKAALMERFALDDIQANAIVQMRLGALTGLEREKLTEELETLRAKIADFRDILASEARQKAIVKDEALEIKRKYNDERRTEIATISGDIDVEDLIPYEDCVLTMTEFGYVKRQKLDAYRLQRRGGRGISGMSRRDEDIARDMFIAGTHDNILFFTSLGRVYQIKCYMIGESSRQSRGINVTNLIPITGDEKVTAMLRVPEFDNEKALVMLTKNGIIKRTSLAAYANIRKNGLIAINIDEGDSLNWVKITDGNSDLIVATKKGKAIRFNETDARELGRTARGVKAITLREGDEVIGMDIVSEGEYVLTVSETGYGRLSSPDDYRGQSRGGQGLTNYHVDKYGDVSAVQMVNTTDDLILISEEGIIIRIAADTIRICARPSKGVRIMKLGANDRLISLARTEHEDEVPEEAEEGAEVNTETSADVTEAVNTENESADISRLLEAAQKDLEAQNSEE